MTIFPKLHEGFRICDSPGEVGIDLVMSSITGIADLMKYLDENGIKVIHFDWSGFVNGESRLFVIIDTRNYKKPKENILRELKSVSRAITEAEFSPVVNGKLIYTRSLFPLLVSQSRGIILPVEVAEGMFEIFKDHFGDDMGTSMLYHLGYAVGVRFYERLLKPLEPNSLEELIQLLDAHLISLGIGVMKDYYIEVDDKLWLRFERVWECESLKGKVNKPAGHTSRGMLSGIFEGYLDHRVVVSETECLVLGYDACKFEVTYLK